MLRASLALGLLLFMRRMNEMFHTPAQPGRDARETLAAPKQIACSAREPGVGVRERSLQEDWEDPNRCCKYFCRAERALSTGSDLLCCSPVKGDRAQGQLLRRTFSTLRSFYEQNNGEGSQNPFPPSQVCWWVLPCSTPEPHTSLSKPSEENKSRILYLISAT